MWTSTSHIPVGYRVDRYRDIHKVWALVCDTVIVGPHSTDGGIISGLWSEWMWKEAVLAWLGQYPGICLENQVNLQYIRWLQCASYRPSSEYQSSELLLSQSAWLLLVRQSAVANNCRAKYFLQQPLVYAPTIHHVVSSLVNAMPFILTIIRENNWHYC
jgi:hypothetical protein